MVIVVAFFHMSSYFMTSMAVTACLKCYLDFSMLLNEF